MPEAVSQTIPAKQPKQIYFITGTDTNVGKTTVACLLLARASQQNLACCGIKPISSGCTVADNGDLESLDATRLNHYASVKLSSNAPIKLTHATAPHIAASLVGKTLNASRIVGFVRGALSSISPSTAQAVRHIVIEGAGGWRVPLNNMETMADVAKQLNLPVILVVGLRLGCLNHALLTVEAIARDGVVLAGWVANCLDDALVEADQTSPETTQNMAQDKTTTQTILEAHLNTLRKKINAPCLGIIPQLKQDDDLTQFTHLIRWPAEV